MSALIQRTVKMEFICPLPQTWNEIYQALLRACESSGAKVAHPPVPLILNGWVFSSDWEKKLRWDETIKWAKENGLTHLIPVLTEEDKYQVEAYGAYRGPIYGEQFFKPKPSHSSTETKSALQYLQANWVAIVGEDLAQATLPQRFSGHKKRRLIVSITNPDYRPPWGSWYSLSGDRRAFTRFRKAINDAIHPMEVDQID
jgi:hypothetical protein